MQRNHVLVVDDDRLTLAQMSDALREAGYPTTCFRDPRAALRALVDEQPVVIVSDYRMPEMDGVEFLSKARERLPHAARVLCTSANDFGVARDAVNSGEVYRIIPKPWRAKELIDGVADAARGAIVRAENDRLAETLRRSNERLFQMNVRLEDMVRERTDNLLEGLIAALDCRDSDTQWHSRRVSRYARRLATQLGIDDDAELLRIAEGALLHDVGKIGVRDEVLRKPGALTPGEWEEMRKHATVGWSLLRSVECLRPSATIVLQHHEKWDGTGYPGRLAGDDIDLGARIFHVVDALDAITSDRPYRKARPFAAARQEIESLAGKHFDPRVVKAFLSVDTGEWEQIRADVETVAILSAELMVNRAIQASPVIVSGGPATPEKVISWKKRLGEILVDLRVIDEQQLESALQYQRWHRCKLGVALVELGYVSEEQVLSTVSRKLGYDRVRLDSVQRTSLVEAALQLVPEDVASTKGIIPLACDRTTLTVAMRDPGNLHAIDELAFRTGRRVKVVIAGEREIERAVARFYSRQVAAAELDLGAFGGEEPGEMQLVSNIYEMESPARSW
jgi:putative nucleotidyltransferase with HDIG domain